MSFEIEQAKLIKSPAVIFNKESNTQKINKRVNKKYLLIDSVIYVLSFLLVYFYKYKHFDFYPEMLSFFIPYFISGGIATVLTRKFSTNRNDGETITLRPFFYSFILMLGLLSGFSFLITPIKASRVVILGSLIIAFIIELIWVRYGIITNPVVNKKTKIIESKKVFFIDFTVLFCVLLYYFYWKMEKMIFYETYQLLFIGIVLTWFISAKLTHKYEFDSTKNYWKYIWGYFKSYILFASTNLFILFFLEIKGENGYHLVTAILIYCFWSGSIISYLFFSHRPAHVDIVEPRLFKATTIIDIPYVNSEQTSENNGLDSSFIQQDGFIEKIKNVYLKSLPELFNWINKRVGFGNLKITELLVLRSRDIYNVEIINDKELKFFINLHEINDIRRINAYFIEVNKKLKEGGKFIGKFEPIKNRRDRFLIKYPYLIAELFYAFDFIWSRVFPKLPIIQKFYFGLSQGRNRALSLAECFGRLYYCGYKIVDLYEPDNFVYFIAEKIKEPSEDHNPSYGPLFKMKRVGKDGKDIFVYKMRTMHPYSEYLQKFVFELNALEEGGKIKNDFRITNWGKIFRKLWLDEFPMFINFFKGELKLVGVRPLSYHYLSLYSEDLRERRKKHKPGLVPPYYADMPKTIEEIMASEEQYLESYEKKPFFTDVQYFFRAWYNIIVKKARSG